MASYTDKRIYQIALTLIPGVGDITARNLLQLLGNPETIFEYKKNDLVNMGLSHKLANEVSNPSILEKAEKEIEFIDKNNISVYFINEDKYPQRLKECSDAPVLFYFKGNVDFNTEKIISIVGTRNSTNYGNNFCDDFLQKIASLYPETLIVSGLAYGIDINAHRAALKHNLPTIGVLAHGLDTIYPATHKQTGLEMLEKGGLLSEFISGIDPERYNFVRRNRIVAGIADTLIVVESDEKGGSLITAEIANSYCKDIFALPGRTTDKYSRGCNKLIASHKADLFQSTEYFLRQMGWDKESAKKKKTPYQRDLFVTLTEEEQTISNKLAQSSPMHIDQLAREINIPAYQLFSVLLEMEMKNIIKILPGNMYTIS